LTVRPARRRRVLLLTQDIRTPGGGNIVAAWAIEALAGDHDVTVVTSHPFSAERVDRFAGTSLVRATYRVRLGPVWLRFLLDISPAPLALLRRGVLMREMARLAPAFDVVLSIDNEIDVGRRAVQYVHFPWLFWPRPEEDMRWYHLAPLLCGYYRLVNRLHPVDRARVAANLTLVNSDWTGRKFRETYGEGSIVTVPPPAPARFPEVPWEARASRFVVLGRIAPEKELEKIVGIVEGVRALGHDVQLLLVGTRERRGSARRYADRILALARRRTSWMEIRLDVTREELARLVASSRWGLHGMAEEHFGIAVAEMVSAGCVPFVPDEGGPVEIVGALPELRYRSASDAIAKIDLVLRDTDLCARLRRSLAERASLFSPERFMNAIREAVARI
jgi:glycosyltransferase involved in cell wall biosynthesis